jgi:hypothetical protein
MARAREDEGRARGSFVVRIWWEKEAEATGAAWRGWAQHAASGESVCFRHAIDLLTFIESHTGSLAQTREGGDRVDMPKAM